METQWESKEREREREREREARISLSPRETKQVFFPPSFTLSMLWLLTFLNTQPHPRPKTAQRHPSASGPLPAGGHPGRGHLVGEDLAPAGRVRRARGEQAPHPPPRRAARRRRPRRVPLRRWDRRGKGPRDRGSDPRPDGARQEAPRVVSRSRVRLVQGRVQKRGREKTVVAFFFPFKKKGLARSPQDTRSNNNNPKNRTHKTGSPPPPT